MRLYSHPPRYRDKVGPVWTAHAGLYILVFYSLLFQIRSLKQEHPFWHNDKVIKEMTTYVERDVVKKEQLKDNEINKEPSSTRAAIKATLLEWQ